jgi:hypothetical protein
VAECTVPYRTILQHSSSPQHLQVLLVGSLQVGQQRHSLLNGGNHLVMPRVDEGSRAAGRGRAGVARDDRDRESVSRLEKGRTAWAKSGAAGSGLDCAYVTYLQISEFGVAAKRLGRQRNRQTHGTIWARKGGGCGPRCTTQPTPQAKQLTACRTTHTTAHGTNQYTHDCTPHQPQAPTSF